MPFLFCRFYINIYKPLHIFDMKVISLMILVQEITAFSVDVREALLHRIPSPPWPCVEESFLWSLLKVTKCRHGPAVISAEQCVL